MIAPRFILLCFLIPGLYGCSSIHDSDEPNYPPNSLCSEIRQKMAPGTAGNIPSTRTVTATEEANLLQEYNRFGCHSDSDNRYAYPNDSLPINGEINDLPVPPPK